MKQILIEVPDFPRYQNIIDDLLSEASDDCQLPCKIIEVVEIEQVIKNFNCSNVMTLSEVEFIKFLSNNEYQLIKYTK